MSTSGDAERHDAAKKSIALVAHCHPMSGVAQDALSLRLERSSASASSRSHWPLPWSLVAGVGLALADTPLDARSISLPVFVIRGRRHVRPRPHRHFPAGRAPLRAGAARRRLFLVAVCADRVRGSRRLQRRSCEPVARRTGGRLPVAQLPVGTPARRRAAHAVHRRSAARGPAVAPDRARRPVPAPVAMVDVQLDLPSQRVLAPRLDAGGGVAPGAPGA